MNRTFIMLLFFAASCGNDKANNSQHRPVINADTLRIPVQSEIIKDTKEHSTPAEFHIKDKSKYSAGFLKEFKERHSSYKNVSLIDDSIIINDDRKEFITIPADLPLNTVVTYETKEKGRNYTLSVKRINYSTLEYNYTEMNKNSKTNQRQGKADLEPVFYLGAEGTFEGEDGNTYGMNEYIDNSEKDCRTYIYIGMGSIEKSFLTHGCETDKEKIRTPELIRINGKHSNKAY